MNMANTAQAHDHATDDHARRRQEFRLILWVVVPVLLVTLALDQVTKLIVLENLHHGESIHVVPGFFSFTLAFNNGAAFGLFADIADGWRQSVIGVSTVFALMVVFYFLLRDYRHDRLAHGAIGLILGGAIGNIIDRVRLGKVVDFLDVYVSNYHWPAFNIADSSICIGVLFLLWRAPMRKALKSAPTSA
jgi:signal peptidase II